MGRLAVDVFFIVSGFLVTRSVLTQPTLVDYAVARFLRLFPALLVATIGIAFVLGPLVTSVSWQDYFSDPRPWLYVPLSSSLITHSLTLPGVFDTVTRRSGRCATRRCATCCSRCSQALACSPRGPVPA